MPCSSDSFRSSCAVCGSLFAMLRLKEQEAADIPPILDTLRTTVGVLNAVPVKSSAHSGSFLNDAAKL